MKTYNRQTGNAGENLAAKYLQEKGYKIIQRNFANKFGEIDIICEKDDRLIFVEVKTKIGDNFGVPEEMVSFGKLQRVRRMAVTYLNGREVSCRLDVVAIVLNPDGSPHRLTHYENVC